MDMKKLLVAIAAASAFMTAPAVSADDAHHTDATVAKDAVMTNAEVRRVDKAGRKITLKHEEIKNLDMPPMTMVFRVKDPAMLDKIKAGDKVKFMAEDEGGAITLTRLEPAK